MGQRTLAVMTWTFGAFENIYELTGDLRGMFGWEERVKAVAEVYESLPPGERERTVFWAAGYDNAGAVDFLGDAYGLPDSVSLAYTYWLWGVPDGLVDTVIGVGLGPVSLAAAYEEVTVAAEVELAHVNPWQTPFVVTIWRKPKVTLEDVWASNRPW